MAQQKGSSGSSIGSAVVFNGVIFLITVGAFLALRGRQPRIYQSRDYVKTIPEKDRPRPLKSGPIGWFTDLVTRKESEILKDAGLDGYFFLRYMRIAVTICVVGSVILLPILLAVNATGGGGESALDLLSFGNVKNSNRYYAHALLSWIFYGFVVFTLYREMYYYTAVRQTVLTSPFYSNLISSRTILIGTVPNEYKSVDAIADLFDGVRYVWINRNHKELAKKVKKRSKLAAKVEGAAVGILKTAVKNRLKSEKKKDATPIQGDDINEYVPREKRPTHKLKPLVGKKVDTIEYGGENMQELNSEIMEMQQAHINAAPLNSAFVTFDSQEHAEVGFQLLSHHRAFQMSPRYIGIRPDDIYWPNLRLFWWERLIRSLVAVFAITALVILWAVPVAFVGALSNLSSLTDKLPWLKFIYNLPDQLLGLITALLPTVLLAALMMLLPIFIRLMAKLSGRPTLTLVEYYTQNAYFAFQVIQVFLVTTLASAATSVVTSIIKEPSSAMGLLANKLPKASNFYISYFLLQGLTASGAMLLQIASLAVFHILRKLLDSTPRKIWTRWNILGGVGWGVIFPVYSNLLVIVITYAMIAPILLPFAALTFFLIYFGYLHNLMFTIVPTDGRGIYYPRAIYQTFTGLYLSEVCLIGLFVVAKAWGPVVLEAVMIAVTVFVQVNMQKAFDPMQGKLPRDLVRETGEHKMSMRSEREKGPTTYDGQAPESAEGTHEVGQDSKAPVKQDSNESDPVVSSNATATTKGRPSGTVVGDDSSAEKGQEAQPKMNAMTRYFKPHKYLTPSVLYRDFLPAMYHEPAMELPHDKEATAFNHPAVLDPNPVVWMPRDPWGLSTHQVEYLNSHGVNAHDEGAWFEVDDEKKKSTIETGDEISHIPIWHPPPKY